jgi:hypothetical protein
VTVVVEQQDLIGRLREALVAFEQAKKMFLRVQRRLNGQPPEGVAAYWRGPGQGIEQRVHSSATEAVAAYRACLVVGLIACEEEQRLIVEARQCLVAGSW